MRPPPLLVWWWGRQTLHGRLALLVTAAVAVAVVLIAGLAWAAVAEIQHRQITSQLSTDAQAIAANPDQWSTRSTVLPGDDPGDDHGRPHDLGPRWQILDARGGVTASSTSALPVTAGARLVAAGQSRPVQEEVTLGGHGYLMLTVAATGGGAVQVAINQDPGIHTLVVLGLLLAGACVLGMAGAAVLGRAVARAGLAPVQRLTAAVEEVAVTTDLNHPIPVHGVVDDIGRLGRSVNTMLAAIDAGRRAQRALVEDAGHELRTPLTSIRTNIDLLLAVERQPELAYRLPPEDRAKLLRDLDSQVGELSSLAVELVELAREDTSREDAEPVELIDIVMAAINRVQTRAPGLTFTTNLQRVMVVGRLGELERMVVNVLDNAAKWSPEKSTVHIQVRANGPDGARLTVTDDGPGIDEVDRPHVFERFYRSAAARAMPGSGLGLAIVAQTASQHGGTVTVEPRSPHGTVVTICLPRLPGTGSSAAG